MATFQPQTDDIGVPNATGFSQGTGPNKTFATLFEGLTNTAKNVINIKDTETQTDIRTDAQSAFDQTNAEFGLQAPDNGPAGLQSELERVSALQNAVSQGKISEVNYYGRLATLSKQLRTRYPGYEAIVDQTIQSVTGTRPANAYRDALLGEMRSAAEGASDETKFQRQYAKENQDVISLLYGDDYFNDPSKYDFRKVQADVARTKGKSFQIQSEKDELGLMAARGDFNDKRAQRTIDQDFSFTVQTVLGKSLGLNQPTAGAKINEFIQKGGGSAQEVEQFIGNISAVEAQLRSELTLRGRQEYVSRGLISAEAVNKSIEAALFPITEAKKAVLGGDFKLAAKYATITKAIEDQQMNEMVKDPTTLAGRGLKSLSDAMGDTFISENQDQITAVAEEAAGRIIGGSPETMNQVIQSGNVKASRAAIDTTFKALIDPKLTGEGFSNAIKSTFGVEAPQWMDPSKGVVAKEDREALFLKFLRPEVTAAIVSKGSKEDLKTYTDWALSNIGGIESMRTAAGDVNSVAALDNLKVQFDEKTNRVRFFLPDGSSLQDNKFYGRTLDTFNKVLTTMEPIMKANGVEGVDVAREVLKGLGIREGGGDQKTLFNKIWEALPSDLTKPIKDVLPQSGKDNEILQQSAEDAALTSALGDVGPDMDAVVKGAGEVLGDLVEPISAPDSGELDFMFESPQEALAQPETVQKAASGPFTGPLEEFATEKTPLAVATRFTGLSEKKDRDVIASFIKKAAGLELNPRVTPWCAAFVNAALGATGLKGTGKLNARSFLDYGTPTKSPTEGDIVVLSRGTSGWQGHVGFFVKDNGDTISILGGNQGKTGLGKVSIAEYSKERILGYRKPPKIN